MNKHERAALVCHQYEAGLANGRDTANVVLKRFPDGFSISLSGALQKIADDALAQVVNALTANGVEKRYIKPFKRGFYTGLRNTYIEHAVRLSVCIRRRPPDCRMRANTASSIMALRDGQAAC
jgi:hypothetical protein